MKERERHLLIRVIFIFLFTTTLCLNSLAWLKDGKESGGFLKKPNLYSHIINYLHKEKTIAKSSKLEPADFIVLALTDLLFSLFCLWLAILLLTGMKNLWVKRYLWFLFIFNLTWLIFLLLFKFAWEALDFMIVKLRPDLGPLIIDNFSLVVIITAGLIYIWLLARIFSLSFFSALGTFLISHLLYFSIIFLCILFVSPKESKLFNLVKENLGIRPIIQSYLLDINKITSGKNILTLVRIRPFRL